MAALTGGPLPVRAFRELAARKLGGLAGANDTTSYPLREEVYFYLLFESFLKAYQEQRGETGRQRHERGDEWDLREAREMQRTLVEEDPERWPMDEPRSLGYVAGYIIRQFSRQWYAVTGRDFLRHRVFRFRGSLTPEAIADDGIGKIQQHAARQDLNLRRDLEWAVGYWLDAYDRLRAPSGGGTGASPSGTPAGPAWNGGAFMRGFWSGYSLNAPARREPGAESESGQEDDGPEAESGS